MYEKSTDNQGIKSLEESLENLKYAGEELIKCIQKLEASEETDYKNLQYDLGLCLVLIDDALEFLTS